MTKTAAMPIYGKNPSKIFFSETNRLISRTLRVKHRWLKYSNVYINHDPVMTLTKFMARSAWVAYAFEWEKLLKMSFEEKSQQDIDKWTNIDYSEKKKMAQGRHLVNIGSVFFRYFRLSIMLSSLFLQ